MQNWSIQKLILDLKYTWKISRNASDRKTNLVVSLTEGLNTGKGEAAPNIRYDESPELLLEQFGHFQNLIKDLPSTISSLQQVLDKGHYANSLRFALESAWHHFEASRKGIRMSEQLDLPDTGNVHTSYTIPIMDPGLLKSFYKENRLHRFRYLKIKIDTESGLDTLRHISTFSDQTILLDPNEAFTEVEQCIYFLEKIRKLKIDFIEQPMPSAMNEEYIYLKKYSPFPLFADESIVEDVDFQKLKQMFDGVNVKLMKAGSYLNAIRLLQKARELGMKTMIGCMVETSLGISSALNLCSLCDYADLDSFMLLKDEPFKLVHEENGIISQRESGKKAINL